MVTFLQGGSSSEDLSRDRAANRMVNYKEFPFPWSQAQKPTGRLLPLRRTSDFWRWAVWSTAHKMWANTRKTKGDSFAPQWNQGPRAYPNPNLERCHLPPPTLWPQDNFFRVLSESESSKEFHTSLPVVWPHSSSKCYLETLASAGSLSDVQKCPCKCPCDTHRNLFIGVSSYSLVSGSILMLLGGDMQSIWPHYLMYYLMANPSSPAEPDWESHIWQRNRKWTLLVSMSLLIIQTAPSLVKPSRNFAISPSPLFAAYDLGWSPGGLANNLWRMGTLLLRKEGALRTHEDDEPSADSAAEKWGGMAVWLEDVTVLG